jgi:Skp family chaperone for outer membrane proteins
MTGRTARKEDDMYLATSLCTAVLSALIAQSGAPRPATKIAVVNLATVFERYQMTSDLEQKFEESRQAVGAEAQSKRDQINLQQNALLDLKPGTPDFKKREDDLLRAQTNFEVWLKIKERDLKRQHMRWLKLIYERTKGVIAKLAADRDIDLVLSYNNLDEDVPDSVALKQQILLRNVLYANNRVNLTERVIELLDADYQREGGAAMLDDAR